MVATNQNIGIGIYGLPEAARLLRVSPARIRSWASPERKLLHRHFAADEHAITFAELMELYFIAMFRGAGVTLETIGRASAAAAAKFATPYPFSVKRFDTDGRTVFATLINDETDGVIVEDLKHGQYVFEKVMKPFFHKMEFRGAQEVSRFWPREKRGRVVLDPARQFGRPIDASTGVPTKAIFDACRAGDGQDAKDVAQWFDVPLAAVHAAVAFERSLLE
jgi:uncharacterized protein (DUF433 family)